MVKSKGTAKKATAKKVESKKKAVKKKASSKAQSKAQTKAQPKASPKEKGIIRQRANFRINEYVVYPTHGVGRITEISEQEVAEYKHEFFVIQFKQERMILKVPVSNIKEMGMRKLSDSRAINSAFNILRQPAHIKRTMWSRRAQEYDQKITSGDIKLLSEVVRDLHRGEHQPDQSYSERLLYEGALARLVDEIAAARKIGDEDALEQAEQALNDPARFDE